MTGWKGAELVLEDSKMKITDVKTWVVGNPPPGIGGKYFIFVKLTTDGGVVGYGEAYNATFCAACHRQMVEDMAERYLVGRDPHDIENFFRRAYSSGFTQRPDVSGMGCFSALEMACWDIIGKEADKPVYKLLGGQVHETLRSYTYLYPHTGSVHSEDAPTARTSTTTPIWPPPARSNMSSRVSMPSSSTRPAPTPPSTATSRASSTSMSPPA